MQNEQMHSTAFKLINKMFINDPDGYTKTGHEPRRWPLGADSHHVWKANETVSSRELQKLQKSALKVIIEIYTMNVVMQFQSMN